MKKFRLQLSFFFALACGLALRAQPTPLNGGSGTGSVTHTGGALTLNSLVLGNGSADISVVAGLTTDGISKQILGVAGSSVGSIDFKNLTSGTVNVAPPTGALGTINVVWPNASSTLPIYGAQMTYTGPSAPRTITYPDASFTVARTDAANTFSGTQTFPKVIGTEFFTTPVTGTTGTTNVITAGEIIYFATFVNGTTTTLTLPVAPALGDNFFVWINGANGSATLTTSATVYRSGDSSSGTVFTPNQVSGANAKHQMKCIFDGTNWWENDTFSSVSEKIAIFSVDGGGSAIATGTVAGTSTALTGYVLTGWSISATGATGTNTVKIWNRATGTAIPTIANVINTNGISLSIGTTVYSTTISDFTDTTYAAQDLFRCAITAVDGTATDLTVTLFGTRL